MASRLRLALVLGLGLALPGCQQVGQVGRLLLELRDIQQKVSARAGTDAVNVTLQSGRSLNIRIGNSPWQQLSAVEIRQKSLDIAKVAYAALAARHRVQLVTVAFSTQRTTLLLFHITNVTNIQRFNVDELSPQRAIASERWVPTETPQADLYLVAIGDVQSEWLQDLAEHFEQKFGIEVTVLSSLSFDRATVFDPQRGQAVADELIAAVSRRYPALAHDNRARVIAVTPYDMYMRANSWNYTFSLRSEDNRFAVVSYARMDPTALGEPSDAERLRARLRKMVAKNIGVMYYGLPLSQNARSVMYGQIGGVEELDGMTEYIEPSTF